MLPAWLQHRLNQSHPTTLLLLSYLAAIIAGTLVLMLPPATVSGHISLINAFFTATSAVCVTGLIVVDTGSYFTLFGQGVILFLIQIGGLGFPVVYEIFSRFFMGQSGKLSIQTKSVVLTTLGLTLAGKLVIIALMIIGRVGVPAITYIIVGGAPKKGLQFAEENLMIG